MDKIVSLVAMTMSLASVSVQASQPDLEKYLTVSSVEVRMETATEKGTFTSVMEEEFLQNAQGLPDQHGFVSEKAGIGEVIAVANQLIALGEKVYELVKKGKPVLNTSYAPISVMPKAVDGTPVDMMDTAGWSLPKSRKVVMEYKNAYGMKVVTFEYTIVFAHSGTYNDRGAYITAAQIVPSNVSVQWGFSFDAKMNLVGLQNHGTTKDPVAGAILNLNYKVNSLMSAIESNDQYHITGRGGLSKL
jgi:hypothetical protein